MNPNRTDPADKQLMNLRIIWASLLMGQVVFLVIVMSLIRAPGTPLDAQTSRIILFVALGMLVMFVPVGYFLRAKTYAQGRQPDGTVTPQSYMTGNIILLAMCESASLLAIVHILLSRDISPGIFVSMLAIAVQAINFPTGAPLRKH